MMEASDLFDRITSGEGYFLNIAGPCAVESQDQVSRTAKYLSSIGVPVLRGGAFKPRTSPDTFQGLGEEGLQMLAQAREETGMIIVTEVMDVEKLKLVEKYTDIIQIGSRNCQNFTLLRRVGRSQKPVLLKRGFGNTIDEFVNSARYISLEGNRRILMVERGIRTFETSTRFTLDISAVPVLKERLQYPVIVDPSHPAGVARYVEPLALAGVAAGADGLMVEVHPDPQNALSDKDQQLNFEQYGHLKSKTDQILSAMGKKSMQLERIA